MSVNIERANADTQLVTWGVILAVLLPIAGFVIGCILVGRPHQTSNGVLCMVGSVAMGAFWAYMLT